MKKTIFAMVMIATMAVGSASARGMHPVHHPHHAGRAVGHFVAGAIVGTLVDHLITTAVEAQPVVVAEPVAVEPVEAAPVVVEEPVPAREVVYVHRPAPVVVHRHNHVPASYYHRSMDHHRNNRVGYKPSRGHHDNHGPRGDFHRK